MWTNDRYYFQNLEKVQVHQSILFEKNLYKDTGPFSNRAETNIGKSTVLKETEELSTDNGSSYNGFWHGVIATETSKFF